MKTIRCNLAKTYRIFATFTESCCKNMGILQEISPDYKSYALVYITVIQEVFHVYLNKFENAVTHLFLVVLGNKLFPWVSLISRNTQSSRK